MLYECSLFEWLTIADARLYSALLTHLECLARLHPMHLRVVDAQRLAVETGMTITLTHIEGVGLDVGTYYEERLFATSNAESLALTYGVEVGAIVFANLLAVTHGVAVWLGKHLELCRSLTVAISAPRRENLVDVTPLCGELLLKKYGEVNLADKADAL